MDNPTPPYYQTTADADVWATFGDRWRCWPAWLPSDPARIALIFALDARLQGDVLRALHTSETLEGVLSDLAKAQATLTRLRDVLTRCQGAPTPAPACTLDEGMALRASPACNGAAPAGETLSQRLVRLGGYRVEGFQSVQQMEAWLVTYYFAPHQAAQPQWARLMWLKPRWGETPPVMPGVEAS